MRSFIACEEMFSVPSGMLTIRAIPQCVENRSILHVPFGKAFILLSQALKSILVLVLIHAADFVIGFKHHGVTVLGM
jgi:hypothetical protein